MTVLCTHRFPRHSELLEGLELLEVMQSDVQTTRLKARPNELNHITSHHINTKRHHTK
jgi:hypothetical protein